MYLSVFVSVVCLTIQVCFKNPSWFDYTKGQHQVHQVTLGEAFGIKSWDQLWEDIRSLVHAAIVDRRRFQFGITSAWLLRPSLSLPAYVGWLPKDKLVPVYNLFDRTGGGKHYSQRITRNWIQDYRNLSQSNSYDEHDGTDLVVPIGTESPLLLTVSGR